MSGAMSSHASTVGNAGARSRPSFRRIYVWESPVRIFHWVNALCIVVLFGTGLYIAHPVLTPIGEPWEHFVMGRIRQVHFASAFVFAGVFFMRILWFFAGSRYARSGFPYVWRPQWWRDLFRQGTDYLRLDFGHAHLGHNALAGLSYTICMICGGWFMLFTGFALYSESDPAGFYGRLVGWVIPLLGGSFRTHMWHHLVAWTFVWFVILHVYIVILDSRQYRNGLIGSMITGYKFRRDDDRAGQEREHAD